MSAMFLRIVLLLSAALMTREIVRIAPQAGPQTALIACEADIAIYGGAAGGGKSFALLLEPLRHFKNKDFGGVIFRRNTTQVRNQGGLWDESTKLYPLLGAHPREYMLEWSFPSGMKMKFAHLEADKTVHDWQGAQIPFIGFDELTHFTEAQFFYMLSRNRSTSGVPGYVRATCNPDADSWVRKLIDWYIGPDGYPIAERSGVIRYFVRIDDTLVWGDTRDELTTKFPGSLPKSFTFIPSKLSDNRILLEKDPAYLANLRALSRVDRLRLEGGNWNVRASAGMYFQRGWFTEIEALPAGKPVAAVRFWDRAATVPHEGNKDPDWTRGLKLLKYSDGTYVVADIVSARERASAIERLVRNIAIQDGRRVKIMSQQDPGSAGKGEAEYFIKMLAGFSVKTETMPADKETRAKPVSAQAEAGNIKVLKAPWNEIFYGETEAFPLGKHDDIVDTLSGAFNELALNSPNFDRIKALGTA